jgi:hypothetical protein
MEKIYLLFLLALIACGDDGEGKMRTFNFTVFDGEASPVNGSQPTIQGATVKVYASAQAWYNGDTPLKTYTTDSKGRIENFDVFDFGAIAYAENGSYNNWPQFINDTNLNPDNSGTPGLLAGSAMLYNTFLADLEAVKTKNYLLTDVRVNTVSIFGSVATCSKDNFIKLQKNLKLIFSEAANICASASATQEFDIYLFTGTKTNFISNSMAGHYEFNTNWTDTANKLYVKTDFSMLRFKVGDTETIYTLQN